MKNLLTINEMDKKEFDFILEKTKDIKENREKYRKALNNLYTIVMLFQRPSTRTRISFEIAAKELSANSVFFDFSSSQLISGEGIDDTSKVLSQYCSLALLRTFEHSFLEEFVKNSKIPIINGATNLEHPLQAISDIFTLKENNLLNENTKIAIIGDCTTAETNSLINSCKIYDMDVKAIHPKGYGPKDDNVFSSNNLEDCFDCNVFYCSSWTNSNYDMEKFERLKSLIPYQVNEKLIKDANYPYIMHPLPAYRGFEITNEIMNMDKSLIFKQSYNRLHTHKAVILHLLDKLII